jgi:thiamine biosynthesis lipoprotein
VTATADPAALPGFGGYTPIVEQPRAVFVRQIMGLPISLHVRGPRAREPRVAGEVDGFFAALIADDLRFSPWKPQSQVSRIRRGELRLRDAEPRLREAAALCEEAAARTGGRFSAWLPGPDGEPAFDPSGLVKGWAVEQAFTALGERLTWLGDHDLLVCAGGDIAVSCARLDTPDWRIAVEDPRDRARTLLTIPLRAGAVATSGTAARGDHVINPDTGAPPTALLSATVIGPDLTWADVYATAAFVSGPDTAAWIAALPHHGAVLVDQDGQVTVTGE